MSAQDLLGTFQDSGLRVVAVQGSPFFVRKSLSLLKQKDAQMGDRESRPRAENEDTHTHTDAEQRFRFRDLR